MRQGTEPWILGLDGRVEPGDDCSGDRLARQALLQIWFSPSFPVGGFAYSQGLEAAAASGLVKGEGDLQGWIAALLSQGSAATDLILVAESWRATSAEDWKALGEVAELAAALQPSSERYHEAITQGRNFVEAISSAWNTPGFARALGECASLPITYPVAIGMAAASHAIALEPLLASYALAFAGSQTSTAIRLGLIGQTAAQRIIAGLLGPIDNAVKRAAAATLEDIGTASFSADLATLEHETLYTRLFRS